MENHGIDFSLGGQFEALAQGFRLQELAELLVERQASRATVAYAMTMIHPAALEDFAAVMENADLGPDLGLGDISF